MKSDYRPLSDFADVMGGKRLPKGKNLTATPTAHPYIRVRNLSAEKVLELTANYEFVDDKIQDTISHYTVNADDVIISIVGTIGLVAKIGKSLDGANLTENCAKVVNIHGLDRDFLYYYLLSADGQNAINVATVGAVQEKLPLKNIRALPIPNVPLPAQRAIAATLSCLDDKIELNRRINANLEAQAQAIFKSWFVDFEPFKDGGFVDSELGRIPKRWKVGIIGDVITLQRGHDMPISKTVPGNYPVLGSTGIIAYHNIYTTKAPCIVLGRSGNIGNPKYYNSDCWAHNTTMYVKTYKCQPLWIFFVLKQLDYSQYKGGSAVPTLNRNHVESHTIIIPPDDFQLRFQKQISVIMEIIDTNINQSRALAAIRDALLPKLMSGEVSPPEGL